MRGGWRRVQGPMGTWVERGAAAVQLQDLLLGFQLRLFAPHELCMIYWCLPTLSPSVVKTTIAGVEDHDRTVCGLSTA